MKRLIVFFLILMCSQFSNAQSIKTDTLAKRLYVNCEVDAAGNREGKYEMIFKDKVLTKGSYKNNLKNGSWEYLGMNDTLQQKGNYIDGLRDGIWESFYSDGKVSCTMPFKKGNKDGLFVGKYKNGNTSFETKYINDDAEGESVHYFENGKISYTEIFKGDTLDGFAKKYYENGVLKEEKYMKGSSRDSVYKFYYEDGTLWEHITYKNGNEFNVIAYNSPDGKPLNCCTLKDGNGVMRFYDKEGRIVSEKNYKNSEKNGAYKYFKNGIQTIEGNYMDEKSEGIWINNYETGELYSKINYSKGEEEGEAFYYSKNGKPIQKGSFENGKRKGLWIKYNENGDIHSEINYLNDMFEGDAKLYEKGKLASEGKYNKGEKVFLWKFYDQKGKVKSSYDYGYSFDVKEKEKNFPYDNELPKNDNVKPLTIVEQMPAFPGGESMMMEFIQKNITYPQEAKENGISGTVYVNFVLDNTGEISKVRIIRGVQKSLDDEATRVVKCMPRWSPGMQSGKPVSVSFNLPIKYTLR